jgi:hypothetical protein
VNWRSIFAATGVLVCLLLPHGFTGADTAPTGSEAVRTIDWSSIKSGSPIPSQMPDAESDDPLDAGFAPEWLKRTFLYADTSSQLKLALEIVAQHPERYGAALFHWPRRRCCGGR